MRKRLQGAIVGVVAGALLAGGIAYAVTVVPPNSTDRYYACVTTAGVVRYGTMRLNVTPTSCPKAADTVRSWNAQGPQGVPGSDATAATAARLPLPGVNLGGCRSATEWGTSAQGSGACGVLATAATFALPVDMLDYPPSATARFTGVVAANSSGASQACVRVYDLDTDAAVPGTTGCLDYVAGAPLAYRRFDLGPFALPHALHHYVVQSRVDYPADAGWSGGMYDTAFVVDW